MVHPLFVYAKEGSIQEVYCVTKMQISIWRVGQTFNITRTRKNITTDIPYTKLKAIHNNFSRATREKSPEVRESHMLMINDG